MWNLIIHILLLLAILHITSKSFKYVKISIFHHYFIPVYSLLIFFISMEWNNTDDLITLAVLFPIALLTGWYETRDLELEKKWDLKKNKYLYFVKRNKPYVFGWIFVLVLGIGMTALFKHESFSSLFTTKVFENFFEQFDPLLIFTTKKPWYTWLLSGVSSTAFTLIAQHKIIGLEKQKNIKTVTKEEVLLEKQEKEKKNRG